MADFFLGFFVPAALSRLSISGQSLPNDVIFPPLRLPAIAFDSILARSELSLESKPQYLKNKGQVTVRWVIHSRPAEIETCVFRNLGDRSTDGGAIQSYVSVSLSNCLFDACCGWLGGAVTTNSSLVCGFTSLFNCSAHKGGAFNIMQETAEDVLIANTIFVGNRGDFYGMMHRIGHSPLSMSSINNSMSRANECVGLFEVKSGAVEMKFCVIDQSVAKCHNGGICTRFLDTLTVDHCVFSRCAHKTTESATGAVFLVYENPHDSTVVESNFVHNEPNGSYVITVVSGHGLSFSRCCFTGSEGKEFHDRNYVTEDCLFEQTDCKPVVTVIECGHGVKRAVKPKRPFRDRTVTAAPWRRNLLVMIGSGIASVAIAAGLTIVQLLIKMMFKRGRKWPKAMQ
jgi:hypothetical protein